MSQEHSIDDIRFSIEKTAEEFFSGGKLSDKINLAIKLSTLPGLDFYSTSVPWRIDLPKGDPIIGFSETLRFAARDIHAQLVVLEKSNSAETSICIGIDATRMPQTRQIIAPKNTLEGG